MAYVEYETNEGVAVITLNRPERRNAMGREMRIALAEAFIRFRDDSEALVAILTGSGNTFCAGADLKERTEVPGGFRLGGGEPIDVATPWMGRPGTRTFREDAPLTKPLITAVNGYAMGGGFGMARRGDLCIAAESARFEITEVHHGGAFGWEWGYLDGLSRRACMELALGERITAQRAYDMGIVNAVVPDDELMATARNLALRIAALPPLARKYNLELARALAPRVPSYISDRAVDYYNESRFSDDAREAFERNRAGLR